MKTKIVNVLKILGFLSIGCVLLWLVYKDVPRAKIVSDLKRFDYSWVILGIFLSMFSHFIRALRWRMLIQSMGYTPTRANSFFAVMIMYLANLAIPRSGEISRCGVLTKYEGVPFTKLLGTVFLERLVDLLFVVFCTIALVVSQYNVVLDFIANNPGISQKFSNPNLYKKIAIVSSIGIIGLVVLLVLSHSRLKNTVIYKKIAHIAIQFKEGILTITRMKNVWLFIAYSLVMYFLYFFMVYLCFKGFAPTVHLGVMAGIAIFVFGSLGMIVPSPGGIGSWHFMTIQTLFVYGIAKSDGESFAFVAHGAMTVVLLIGGFFSLVALPLFNKDISKKQE